MKEELSRLITVYGEDAVNRLRNKHVAVFGIGGVGGYVAEALARSGIGTLTLIDHDTVCLSNINRQIIALHSTVGMKKVDVARARILDIDPECNVIASDVFYLPETAHLFDFSGYDYIVDAIDTVSGKLAIIENARKSGTPVISSMGTGNKTDPSLFRISDIRETSVCPLARVMRKELKIRGIDHVKVVWSPEEPVAGNGSVPGSTSFCPPVAGLLLAGEVVNDLVRLCS